VQLQIESSSRTRLWSTFCDRGPGFTLSRDMPKDRKVVKHVMWGGHAGVLVAGESFEAL